MKTSEFQCLRKEEGRLLMEVKVLMYTSYCKCFIENLLGLALLRNESVGYLRRVPDQCYVGSWSVHTRNSQRSRGNYLQFIPGRSPETGNRKHRVAWENLVLISTTGSVTEEKFLRSRTC
jgi:hypothetical protein